MASSGTHCPKNHPLKLFPLSQTKKTYCGECKQRISDDKCLMCMACDYNYCLGCRRAVREAEQRKEEEAKAAEQSAAQGGRSQSTGPRCMRFRQLDNLRTILAAAQPLETDDGSKCPKGHLLKLFPVPGTRRILCEACRGVQKDKCSMCAACDYALCLPCQKSQQKAAVVEAAKARQSKPNIAEPGRAVIRSGLVSTEIQRWKKFCDTQWPGGWDELKNLLKQEAIEESDLVQLLGAGRFGKVHRIKEPKSGNHRVIKTCEMEPGWDSARLTLEGKILQNMDHPHVLRAFAWYEYDDMVSIVMDDCTGGELLRYTKQARQKGQQPPEAWSSTAMRQCFSAIAYVHEAGLVHKDLKGANLLLMYSSETAGKMFGLLPHTIVCDFGLAEICKQGSWFSPEKMKVAGTPSTRAPEVVKGIFNFKADVWSLGIVMFEQLSDVLPFEADADDNAAWEAQYKKGPDWRQFPDSMQGGKNDAQSLCAKMLTVQETKRPTAADCLLHPWIVDNRRSNLSAYDIDAMKQAGLEWRTLDHMVQAFRLWMVAGPSGAACLKKCSTLFTQFDTKHEGTLDHQQVSDALAENLEMQATEAASIAKAMDLDHDGYVQYLEFSACFLAALEERFDDLLRADFGRLDVGAKGYLSKSDVDLLKQDLDALILNLDTLTGNFLKLSNANGEISASDFFKFFGRPNVDYGKRFGLTPAPKPKQAPKAKAKTKAKSKPKPKPQPKKQVAPEASAPLQNEEPPWFVAVSTDITPANWLQGKDSSRPHSPAKAFVPFSRKPVLLLPRAE